MSYDVYVTRQGHLYVADVPALPGCRTIGRSEQEALENIRSVVEGYLKTMKRRHSTLPQVKVFKVCEDEFTPITSA